MSFKGITWAGNVYEKFEAMCLEVEEAMYQDTVKYVENQVQKVGVSVKKFYSEVMDDMRPLSCIDPTSVADDLSPIPYGYTDVNKKPTPGILDNRRDLKKKKNDDQVLLNITAEKGSSNVCLFSPQSPGIFIEHKSPEKCAVSKKIGVQRRAIGIKRISKSNYPSKDSCRTTSTSEDKGSKVASCDTRTNSRLASDNMDVTSSSDFAGRCGAREAVKGNAPNLNHSIESPASDEVLLPQSVRQDSLRASSRLASDNMDVTSSSDFAGRCEAREAVKGNAPNLNHPIESPASDEVLSSESVRQDSLRAACDDSIVTSSSNIMMQEHAEAVKGNTALQDNLIKSPASEKALLAESMRQIGDVSDCIPPDSDSNLSDDSVRLKGDPEATTSCSGSPAESAGMSVNDIVACSSFRTEVCNLEYEEKGTVSNEGTSIKDCSLSADSPSCNVEV
ncbi:uncharacterized protein LOC131012311 isoform X2 [Salvia miltiorrhiza]|uniref:uncharacterized protein LOC131012311 isoform X2 n=1 Tax=Salvia miltiorrhiza TaxID=226208 RepID=UPI0025ACFD72|nr:uncharacterized protein LOC131012311 isoform X2 [Salvia miltiorrhiza]XP_057796228.1 uncharacterized protein LOC131012311 isoform X2 [Salvia miltiorrhiza]XP_057796229.1 uncharacterized protein LOC131012311 isoform X2 [Salvia miltiorrhiza]XP_057796230.1 uncharacterized protein LOC131012311 isoform X2 [Salvia miltiorrhiza]